MSIIVDVRERDLYHALVDIDRQGLSAKEPDQTPPRIQKQALAYGDVWIVSAPQKEEGSDEPAETPRVLWVGERKTLPDLAASIKDGRYREQKLRLQVHAPQGRVAYLVEASGSRAFSYDATRAVLADPLYLESIGMRSDALLSSLIHSMFRDGIHVVHTGDIRETAAFAWHVFERLAKDPSKFDKVDPNKGAKEGYLQVDIQARRCKMRNEKDRFLAQLCMIPGVSQVTGKSIVEKYRCMGNLVRVLEALSRDLQVRELMQVPHVGKKTAQVILDTLYCNDV